MRTPAPRWQLRRQLVGIHVPVDLRDWLFATDSLTRRLRAHCGPHFALQLVSARWSRPLADERGALHLPGARTALVRQVYLLCDGRPLVFARSVIPPGTLKGGNQRLARLGARPLAGVLFGASRVPRGRLEIARLQYGHTLYALATRGRGSPPPVLWARRSLFFPAHKPLLVTEVFFPELGSAPGRGNG
jgi:chorismate--pyruvate lyase